MKKKLSLGISPCPNDTYIFYALITGKIKHPFEFDFVMADVEELNHAVMNNRIDVCKLSFNAFGHVLSRYQLLDSGAALGISNGPLLIKSAKKQIRNIESCRIAIPGEFTTANLLLTLAFPNAQDKHPILFSEIEERLRKNEFDLGLIIHETRFTYRYNGFELVKDLGQFWEDTRKCPLPLGGIACKKSFNQDTKRSLAQAIKESILYADKNPAEALNYCRKFAQEMSEEVMHQHIQLYVNEYSKSLGSKGKMAVIQLLNEMQRQNLLNSEPNDIFAIS